MSVHTKTQGMAGAIILACLVYTSGLGATNGAFMTAYGARSAGLGGATLAVGGSPLEMQANPSQLSRLQSAQLEGSLALLSPFLEYQDSFSDADNTLAYANKVTAERSTFPVPSIAFGTPVGTRMGFGISLVGRGGFGADFRGITRPLNDPGSSPKTLDTKLSGIPVLGARKNISESTFSSLTVARLTVGGSIRFGKLHIGVGADLDFSQLEFRYTFQDPTGTIDLPGAGYRYRGSDALSFSGKVGLTYDATDRLSLAYAYQAKSRSRYDGTMSVNAGDSSILYPARTSAYLDWPEIHSAGVAYKIGRLTLAFEIDYVKWAAAFRTVDFVLDQPYISTPFGNKINNLTFNQYWEDQRIYAVGLEYATESFAYRFGYNYGNSPVHGGAVNPIFPAITEHHAFVGLGFKSGNLSIDFALEYAFKNRVSSTDTDDWEILHALFSSDDARLLNFQSSVTMRQITPHIGVKYRF